jgi:hypothetical protein
LDSEELISVITSNHDNVLIGGMERAMEGFHVLRRAYTLEGEALLLVPVPQYDFVTILTSLTNN